MNSRPCIHRDGMSPADSAGSIIAVPNALHDETACSIRAGELEAVFLPQFGMLGASLRHRGVELLRRVDDLPSAAAKGSTAGIPLLHPWANRLAAPRYAAAGREVTLDPASPLLHTDENGLPIHGVPWGRLRWELREARPDALVGRLDWSRPEWLAVFPYPHRLDLTATIRPDGLTIETKLTAGPDGPTPVSFGFHPYFGLPGVPRDEWRLQMPTMGKLVTDARGIPTGAESMQPEFDALLRGQAFDDGFALTGERAAFALFGGGRRIGVEFLAGYRYAQIFAPPGKELIAIEPMTAPTNALISGRGLTLVPPGGEFRAEFRITVSEWH